jgi:hypothetical protein
MLDELLVYVIIVGTVSLLWTFLRSRTKGYVHHRELRSSDVAHVLRKTRRP